MESRTRSEREESKTDSEEAAQTMEGPVAKAIESKTAQLPSDIFLWASVASMVVSLGLQLSGRKRSQHVSNFIGQWAPTLLVLGLYNKIVKVAGHDRASETDEKAQRTGSRNNP
jgi:hypothetical protein